MRSSGADNKRAAMVTLRIVAVDTRHQSKGNHPDHASRRLHLSCCGGPGADRSPRGARPKTCRNTAQAANVTRAHFRVNPT